MDAPHLSPSSQPPIQIAIILLNYGRYDETFACLDSLKTLANDETIQSRIVVVDNASLNDSVVHLQGRLLNYPNEFELVISNENLGYSGGCNVGITHAQQWDVSPDAYWLLNNDATVEPNTLIELVNRWQETQGLVGSLLLYPDGSYQQVGTQFNRWTGRSRGYSESMVEDGMHVEMLTGASWLIPDMAIRQVGLLDESFFLYFEDGEFSLRCNTAGYPLTIALRSRVYHKESATTGRNSPTTQYYYHRNRLYLLRRIVTPLQTITIEGYALFRLLRFVLKFAMAFANKKTTSRIALQAYWYALTDYWQGRTGACPHTFHLG